MCRVFVELLDQQQERFARENGPDLEYVGSLRKCMYGSVDASARWQAHYLQMLKEHGFGNLSLFVHVERDV